MAIPDLPLVCRIPATHLRSQANLMADGWREIELFNILGRGFGKELFALDPHIRALREEDQDKVLDIIRAANWTSRLFRDATVPRETAISHKCSVFELGVMNGAPIFVYDDGTRILGFVQMNKESIELIASTRRGIGHKLLHRACWATMNGKFLYITAGTSNHDGKVEFYRRNGFTLWESFVTFHKWKDGAKPSLPSCKPDLAQKGSRRKPSARSLASR